MKANCKKKEKEKCCTYSKAGVGKKNYNNDFDENKTIRMKSL